MENLLEEENIIATSIRQTPEGLIHMISNERGEASAELAIGSPEVEEGSVLKRKSKVTEKDIAGLFRALGAGVTIDVDNNLILESLKSLISVVETLEVKAVNEKSAIEKDSYKSCLNFLVAALESINFSSNEVNIKASKVEIESQELKFNSPKIHFGIDTSLQEDKKFNGEEDVDINREDIPLTLNRFKCWWNSEIAPAFESVLSDLANKFNNHTHIGSASASALKSPMLSGENLKDFDKKLENASIASKLSAAKTITVL